MSFINSGEKFPLKNELIIEILLHKEAHFHGSFELMLDYYRKDGKGTSSLITTHDILVLYETEKTLNKNLSALLLNEDHYSEIDRSKELYKKFKEVYEDKDITNLYSRLIADLILSEEEDPINEINAIVSIGKAIVPALVEISRSEDLNNPLFPGYGQAPSLAIRCLGEIGDERSMYTLFEQIGREEVLQEEVALAALKAIGPNARDFLLKVLQSKPYTEDNERASIALINFKNDPIVPKTCLNMLLDEKIRNTLPLAAYLTLACEGLSNEEDRDQFCKLSRDSKTPSILHIDFDSVIKSWKNSKKEN